MTAPDANKEPYVRSAGALPASNPADSIKQTLLSVVQLWLDRLQHQAVVVSLLSLPTPFVFLKGPPQTTFFVSIDSLLFSLTSSTRNPDLSEWSSRDMAINAALGGAIIFHVCACEFLSTCLPTAYMRHGLSWFCIWRERKRGRRCRKIQMDVMACHGDDFEASRPGGSFIK